MTLTSADLSNFNENLRRYVSDFLHRQGKLDDGKPAALRVYGVNEYRTRAVYSVDYNNGISRFANAYRYSLNLTDDNTITLADTQAYDALLNSALPVYIHAAKIRFLQQYCAGMVDFLVCSTSAHNVRENKILEFFGWSRSVFSNKGYNDHILWTRPLRTELHQRFVKFYEKFSSRCEEKD